MYLCDVRARQFKTEVLERETWPQVSSSNGLLVSMQSRSLNDVHSTNCFFHFLCSRAFVGTWLLMMIHIYIPIYIHMHVHLNGIYIHI